MNEIINIIVANKFWVYPLLVLSSFINIIVPISGSATVTPLISNLYGAKEAIAIASILFVINGLVRIFIFRKHIVISDIKKILPLSLIGALTGAFVLAGLSNTVITVLLIIFLASFFIKKLRRIRSKRPPAPPKKYTEQFVGFLSGLLQGGGLTGGVDLRNGYLFSKDLSLAEVNGTTAVVGTSNFALATLIRLATHQIIFIDLVKIIWVLPFMFLGIALGRKVSLKIPIKSQNYLALAVIVVAIMLLIFSVK